MKRCPECRRDYYDDSLLYCLDDGAALVEGPTSPEEAATAILSKSVVGDGHASDPSGEPTSSVETATGQKNSAVAVQGHYSIKNTSGRLWSFVWGSVFVLSLAALGVGTW